MVRKTVHRMGRNLERLASRDIPVEEALDIMYRRARTVEEMVVVEVMREAVCELAEAEPPAHAQYAGYAESNTRSA